MPLSLVSCSCLRLGRRCGSLAVRHGHLLEPLVGLGLEPLMELGLEPLVELGLEPLGLEPLGAGAGTSGGTASCGTSASIPYAAICSLITRGN